MYNNIIYNKSPMDSESDMDRDTFTIEKHATFSILMNRCYV